IHEKFYVPRSNGRRYSEALRIGGDECSEGRLSFEFANDKRCTLANAMKFTRTNIKRETAVNNLQIGKMNGVAAVHLLLAYAIGTHTAPAPLPKARRVRAGMGCLWLLFQATKVTSASSDRTIWLTG